MAKLAVFLCIMVATWAVIEAAPGATVVIQFDNTLSRVRSNIKVVTKYVGEKLCRVKPSQVVAIKGRDLGNMLNHKSEVTFVCLGAPAAIIKNCNGMWNRHQVKDEIKDHTTPDIEVQKVLQCGPAVNYMPTTGH